MAEYDAGAVVARIKADPSGFHASVQTIKGDVKSLRQDAKDLKVDYRELGVAAGVSFAAITAGIWKATEANNQLKASMMGLDSIAKGTVGNYSKIQAELQKVRENGMIPLNNAINAYKNLLSRYKDEDTAIKMFYRLADAAAFGRQGHLSLGDAIQGATEGLKNEMSQLVDNAGVTKNVSQMWKDYAAQIGKTVGQLTDAEKRQAEVNGIIEETRFQVGDMAKLQNSLSGSMSKNAATVNEVAIAYGEALEPALTRVSGAFGFVMDGVRNFVSMNPELVAGATAGALALTGLTAAASGLHLLIPKLIAGLTFLASTPVGLSIVAISALTAAFVGFSTVVKKARDEDAKMVDTLKGRANAYGEQASKLDGLLNQYEKLQQKSKTSREAQKQLQDVVKQIGQIAPSAVTQWNNLGDAISINADKARQAMKEMIEARKGLLQVALARAEYELPQAEQIIREKEGGVKKARTALNAATKKREEAVRRQIILREIQKNYGQQNWYREAVKAGLVSEGDPLAGFMVDDDVNRAYETESAAAKKLEEASKEYDKAMQKKAKYQADVAELNALIDQEGNLGKKPKTSDGGGSGGDDKRSPYQAARDQYEADAEAGQWSLEKRVAEWSKLEKFANPKLNKKATDKEFDDFKERMAKLNNELAEAQKKVADELALERAKGREKELLALEQSMEEELKTVEKGSQREEDIRARYQIQKENLTKKWDAETLAQQKELQAAMMHEVGNYEQEALLREEARYAREISDSKLTKEQLETLEKEHQQNILDIKKDYADKRSEVDLKMREAEINSQIAALENQKKTNELTYDEATARSLNLAIDRKIAALQIQLLNLRIADLKVQREKVKSKEEEAELTAQILELETARDNITFEVDNQALEQMKELRDAWSDTMNDLAKGTKDFGDVWDEIMDRVRKKFFDTLFDMIMESQSSNVFQQILGILFGFAGGGGGGGDMSGLNYTPKQGGYYHHGGMIEPLKISKAHVGMLVSGLKRDEVPIIAQAGEEVLSRADRSEVLTGIRSLLAQQGQTQQTVIQIQAVDAASFAELTKRYPEAIIGPLVGDFNGNGVTRKLFGGGRRNG